MKKYVFALCLTSTSLAWGACERTDVEFYLNKGFTPEQITSLCGDAPAVPQTMAPVASESVPVTVASQKTVNTVKQNDIIARLSKALRISNIAVKDNVFTFLYTPEIEYGRPMIGGDYRTVKPKIDVSIPMSSLRVLTASEGIPMIRSPYMKLGGDITRTVQNLDALKQQQRTAVNKYLVGQHAKKIILKFQLGAQVDEASADVKDLIDMYR